MSSHEQFEASPQEPCADRPLKVARPKVVGRRGACAWHERRPPVAGRGIDPLLPAFPLMPLFHGHGSHGRHSSRSHWRRDKEV